MAGALEGIRVVEAGLLVQGPQAAATLGEWGADVVKVELPGFGDQSRWLPIEPGDPRSGYFTGCNRGKRSVTIDLRRDEGREVFLRLAEWADVIITNFKPGTMDAWGLGYEAVAARNPRVVYAAGSTFGLVGPDAGREGADLSAQAVGGLISTTGRVGGEPTPVGVTIADHIAAQNLVERRPGRSLRPGADGPRSAGRHLAARRPDLGPGQRVHRLPAARALGRTRWKRVIPWCPGCTACSRPPTAGSPWSAWSAPPGRPSTR